MTLRAAAAALLLSTAGLAGATTTCEAAGAVPVRVVGQHATVMNDLRRDRQRNNAVISHVQNNIRSTRPY